MVYQPAPGHPSPFPSSYPHLHYYYEIQDSELADARRLCLPTSLVHLELMEGCHLARVRWIKMSM